MNHRHLLTTTLLIPAIWATSAAAQTGPVPSNASVTSDDREEAPGDDIVVTGRAGGAEQRKVDASFAISTLDDTAIAKIAPHSTADLLKAIPGVWAESSGGVSGANINLRGFPGTGDAPFVTVQLNGVPIFTPPSLSFLENSTLFRVDDTIARVEGLRGGPNPILSNGQPGLITNFILKEGGDETKGGLRLTTSTYDLLQVDGVLSGKLADELYFMVGGYAQQSRGVREADFTSEKGYQFTANLTKKFAGGKINLYFRRTNDHGVWYLPSPLNVPGIDASFVQISSANRRTAVEGPYGGRFSVDYGKGRGFDGFLAGGSVEFEAEGGWSFVDRFNYLKGDADTYGLSPRGGPRTLRSLGLASAQTVISKRTLGPDDYVQHIGFQYVTKDVDSLTNDLTVSKTIGNGTASLGYFASRFGSDDLWNLNNNARYFELANAKEQVAITCATVTAAPAPCLNGTRLDTSGNGSMNAVYFTADQEFFNALRIDGGVRWVDHRMTYAGEVGGDPVNGLSGVPNTNIRYHEQGISWTAGVNYAFSRDMGVFVRINDGFRLPYFDDLRGGQTQLAAGDDLFFDVRQYEAGFKLATGGLGLYLTAFRVETQATRSLLPTPDSPISIFETEANGIEFDANYSMGNGFSINAAATYLDGKISADPVPSNVGNQAPRQPKLQFRFSPSYAFEIGSLSGSVYGAYSHVGKRQSNIQNTQPLPAYNKFDLGVEMRTASGLYFRVFGDNITDEQGLTEGDPASFDINANGRYILPRSVRFSIGYDF